MSDVGYQLLSASKEIKRLNGIIREAAAEIKELKAANSLLKGAIKADDERLLQATKRINSPPWGCDTAEHLADEILELRAENARLKKTISELYERLQEINPDTVAKEGK